MAENILEEEENNIDPESLLGKWHAKAYNRDADQKELKRLWDEYFLIEKGIYAELLKKPDEIVRGTVKELAETYDVSLEHMVAFLDGINDSLVEKNPIETMTEDTEVNLGFDKTLLYKNMVDAKADWLYELPEWDDIFTKEEQHRLYVEQKKSGTIIKPRKIGRNEPCPCGSGKKFKYCHGRGGQQYYIPDEEKEG